jgi:hypothetical protein
MAAATSSGANTLPPEFPYLRYQARVYADYLTPSLFGVVLAKFNEVWHQYWYCALILLRSNRRGVTRTRLILYLLV